MTMIQHVAMCMAGCAWSDLEEADREFWLQRSRAAVEAMRHATDDMAAYAKHRNPGVSEGLAKGVFLCMIDQALTK